MKAPKPETIAAQRRLGASPERLAALLRIPSLEEARTALEKLKAEVKKTYKRLAFELHPDLHNDPSKTEELVLLTEVRDRLMELEIGRQPPRPRLRPQPTTVPFMVVVRFGGFGPTVNSTSPSTNQTTSSTGGGWGTPGWWPPTGSGTF